MIKSQNAMSFYIMLLLISVDRKPVRLFLSSSFVSLVTNGNEVPRTQSVLSFFFLAFIRDSVLIAQS